VSEENIFLEINQLETGIACGGHVIENLPYIVPEPAFPNELKFDRKPPWKVFYNDRSFRPDSLTNMATTGNYEWPTFKNLICLWQSCLLTDRDEMDNLYIGPSIDASYHVSVNLARRFQRRRFLKVGGRHRQFLFPIG
jgi:hypothetical protein